MIRKHNKIRKTNQSIPNCTYKNDNAQERVMLTATRNEPSSSVLYLFPQSSPTSPKKGDIKYDMKEGTFAKTNKVVTEKYANSYCISFCILFIKKREIIPVLLTIATAKSKKRPDLVVTQVFLYRLEKEGGQHEDADLVLPTAVDSNSGDLSLVAIFEQTTTSPSKRIEINWDS